MSSTQEKRADYRPDETELEQPRPRPSHPLPESIGPYHIIEVIGEGGMGVVYKAEQRDPVRRVAAIKVIKLGMDTKEIIARFDAERQALALMSHPNVAKVFEAGMTDTGRPYFAMEFVPGVSITNYCDTQKLTTRERLELFIPVCQAIQHAHQKGIIHRDLKPGNILITLFDGKPVPKVIDFGVAKATSIQLTDKTLFTQTGTVIGTLEYMSPEQATSSGLDVDTRTDVYSLGVILYQLLTGSLPFEPDTLRKASAEQLMRIIQDTDPLRPSARLTEAARRPRPETTEIARRHRTDPRTLRRELLGDLDWIVLKAIEKDRTRRYETANGLAMDLRRHLDDEPVLARSPSNLYRFRKFWKRHTVGLVAATIIALAVLVGSAATAYAFIQRHERIAKELEAKNAADNADHISHLFQDSLSLFDYAGLSKTARQTLDELGHRLDARELAGNPLVEARVRSLLAHNYMAIGLYQRAISQHLAALEVNRRLHGPSSPSLIHLLNELAEAQLTEDDLSGADNYASEAFQIEQQADKFDPLECARTLDLLGSVRATQDKWVDAESLYTQAWNIRVTLSHDGPDFADSLAHKADVLLHRDSRNSEGLRVWRDATEHYRHAFIGQPAGFILGRFMRMGRSCAQRHDWQSAFELFQQQEPQLADLIFLRERITIISNLMQLRGVDTTLLARRGGLYGRLGQFGAALEDYANATNRDPGNPRYWHLYLPLLLQEGRTDLYETKRGEALAIFSSKPDPRAPHAISKSSLCRPIQGTDAAIAFDLARKALNSAPTEAFFLQGMGMAEYRVGRFDEAIIHLTDSCDHVYAYRDAMADFYLAMTLAARDHVRAAAAFEAGMRLWESSIPTPGNADLEQFEDWIMCAHVREEARSAVGTSG